MQFRQLWPYKDLINTHQWLIENKQVTLYTPSVQAFQQASVCVCVHACMYVSMYVLQNMLKNH